MHRRKDGTRFSIEATLARYRVDGVEMVLGSIRDISERRAAEAEQRRVASELARRVDQQMSVVQLGQRALEGGELQDLFAAAVDALCDTLAIEQVVVLERRDDGSFVRRGGTARPEVLPAGGLAGAAYAERGGLHIGDLVAAGYGDDRCAPRRRAPPCSRWCPAMAVPTACSPPRPTPTRTSVRTT